MAVALGSATGIVKTAVGTTLAHTTGAGTDLVLVIWAAMDNRNDVGTIPAVTISPVLTVTNIAALNTIDTGSGSEKNSLFTYIVTGVAASTTYTITVPQSALRGTEILAADFSGVDQTTPHSGGAVINDVSASAVSRAPSILTPSDGFSVGCAGGYKGSAVAVDTTNTPTVLGFQGGNGSHAAGISTLVGNGTIRAHEWTVTAGGSINGAVTMNILAGASGPQASGAITDGNDVAAGVADVQKITITHVFRNEADTAFWANGINVVAYKASTMSAAVPTVMGNAAIAGGVGSVTITLTENASVVLVPDHQHASAPTGEQGISEALTPTVA